MGLEGLYQDEVRTAHGVLLHQSQWHRNTIVDSARVAIAALLKGGDDAAPIVRMSLGTGDPLWDEGSVKPHPAWDRLVREVDSVSVDSGFVRMRVLPEGEPGDSVPRVEVDVEYTPREARALREFALVAARASQARLVNYVVHPLLSLAAGQTLTRHVVLRFPAESEPETPPSPNLGRRCVALMGTDAMRIANELDARTISELVARLSAGQQPPSSIPSTKSDVLARGRLALSAAAALVPLEALSLTTCSSVIRTSAEALARTAGVSLALCEQIRERVGMLYSVLDSSLLGELQLEQVWSGAQRDFMLDCAIPFEPRQGKVGASVRVYLTSGLDRSGLQVLFGELPAQSIVSGGKLVAVVPQGLAPDSDVPVRVTSADGAAVTAGRAFHVLAG